MVKTQIRLDKYIIPAHLFFKCCLLPMHRIRPLSNIAILVQSASHSSMECEVRMTARPARLNVRSICFALLTQLRSLGMYLILPITLHRNCCDPGSMPAILFVGISNEGFLNPFFFHPGRKRSKH